MLEVIAWLKSNRNYSDGFALYQKYGDNDILKKILRKESGFNRNKLISELLKIAETVKEKQEEVKQEKEIGIYTGNDYDQLPAEVKDLIARAKHIYKEIGSLHGRMVEYVKQAVRIRNSQERDKFLKEMQMGDLANTILDKDEERADLIYQVDFYKANRRLPAEASTEKQPGETLTEGEIRAQLARLRPWISKNRNKPDRKAEVAARISEKEQLERRLYEIQ